MATKFSDIYDLFLAQIDDYELGSLEDEEIDFVAEKYLINALINVQESISDFEDVDMDAKQFNNTIPLPEQIILAKSMKLEWVSEKKYSQELMQKSIGDRDYKAVQGVDYLKTLTSMEKSLRDEIKRLINNRSYTKDEFYGSLLT